MVHEDTGDSPIVPRDTDRSIPLHQDPTVYNPIGRTIHGKYRIKRLLGIGGMGRVYEAVHVDLDKRVALKLVDFALAEDPEVASRIMDEARAIGRVESDHIVQVFDAGEDADLGVFLVMELLRGEDLAHLLARDGQRTEAEAADLVAQAARGLARAHAAGIVHRDLKPANVFVNAREEGGLRVKVVDFGIAKLLQDASREPRGGNTGTGKIVGTPQYMSPEQAQGLDVDHRTDIYSLGAVLFEAITGESPYQEMLTYEQTIMQIVLKPCPRISSIVPDVHPALDQLCAEMMAPVRDERPVSMMVVRDRLAAIVAELAGAPARTSDLAYAETLAPPPARCSRPDQTFIMDAEVASAPARACTEDTFVLARSRTGSRAAAARRPAFATLALVAGIAFAALAGGRQAGQPASYASTSSAAGYALGAASAVHAIDLDSSPRPVAVNVMAAAPASAAPVAAPASPVRATRHRGARRAADAAKK